MTDPNCRADTLESNYSLEEALELRRPIEIVECAEPLVEIPSHLFFRCEPHPYLSAGAPYGRFHPYYVRSGVLDRLMRARQELKELYPTYDLVVFDAYRPRPVQSFMVDLTARRVATAAGQDFDSLTGDEKKSLFDDVYKVWAKPSSDPLCPPPHSTGAAIDLYIVDSTGKPVPMGSEIDEISPRSLPNYFRGAVSEDGKLYHVRREALNSALSKSGFRRLTHEWWHFSYGDQMWAFLESLDGKTSVTAIYGAVE